jgi:uncharacterized GH25 family protein
VTKRAALIVIAIASALVAVVLLTRDGRRAAEITGRTISIDAGPREVETVRTRGVQSDADPTGTLRLEGQVIDAADEPVRAIVAIDSNPPREVETEADGSFVFDQLTPRTYRIAARDPQREASVAVSIRLTRQTEPVILRLAKAGTIAVRVATERGEPIRDARVEVRDQLLVAATTDAGGRAVLAGIAGGWHVIKASAAGHASAFVEIATTASGETRVELTLRAGVTVSGTVVDGAGTPISGARVVPEHLGHYDDYFDSRFDAAVSDARGAWQLAGLPRETLRMRATHPEFAPGVSAPVTLDGDRSDLAIVLGQGATLNGRVVDASKRPVAGAEIRISEDTVLGGQVRRATSDARGGFTIRGLPRRRMLVMAASDDAASRTLAIDFASPVAPVELVLDQVAAIEGIVVTTSGTPVPEARVVAELVRTESTTEQIETRLRGDLSAIAGMDGRFRIAPLASGRYLVRAIRPGSANDLLGMRVGAPVATGAQARIVVDELSRLIGKVAFADGTPVTSFAIRLGGSSLRRFQSDTGAFAIDDVPAGKQYVEITGPSIVSQPLVEVAIEPARVTDLGTITVSRGRVIAGRVVDRAGRPVAGAMVALARELRADGTSLVPFPGSRVLQVATDPAGRFELRSVGVGMQQIAAEHDTGRSPIAVIQAGDIETEVTLTLLEAGAVQGRVRIDGKPGEALILLRPETAVDSRITVRTGADGSYRFDRVAAERYTHITVVIRGTRDENTESKSQPIEVKPGQTLELDVELTAKGVTVIEHLASPDGAVQFGYGILGIVDDPAAVTLPLPHTISEGRAFGAKVGAMTTRDGMIVKDRQIAFARVPPGKHIGCIAPLRGDPADPQVLAELQRGAADWPLYCKWLTIAGAPDPQHVTIEVLPAPPPTAR